MERLQHRGLAISRAVRSIALATGNKDLAIDIAIARFGEASDAVTILKGAVGTDWGRGFVSTYADKEFFAAVAEREVLTRLPALRRVPPRVRHIIGTEGTTASFVGSRAPVPVSAMELSADSLDPMKVCAITVATNETLKSAATESENFLQADMVTATAAATDAALLDPSNAGSADTPQAITYNAPSTAATGSEGDDFASLVESFGGDLTTSALVMHPTTAAQLALTGNVAFQAIGARGGEALGLPVLTTREIPLDSSGGLVALVDGAGIAMSEYPPEFSTSQAGMIQLSTAPDSPINPGVSKTVSLFQEEATAIKIVRRIIWKKMRANAVSILTGAWY